MARSLWQTSSLHVPVLAQTPLSLSQIRAWQLSSR
jgi:hypothetical protein